MCQKVPLCAGLSARRPGGRLCAPDERAVDAPARRHSRRASAALRLAKDARCLPAVLSRSTTAWTLQRNIDLTTLMYWRSNPCSALSRIDRFVMPAADGVSEAGRLHVFRPDDGGEEHYAIEIGTPDRTASADRLHSACFTGDLMGSLKCDCGPQLACRFAQMGAEGAGVLLYLNQEGAASGLPTRCAPIACRIRGLIRSRQITDLDSRMMSGIFASARRSCVLWDSRLHD